LTSDVINTYGTQGTEAAVIQGIGGSGTILASTAAASQCALLASPSGPVGAALAGIACGIGTTIMGHRLTDTIIEHLMEVEDVNPWTPSEEEIERCAEPIHRAISFWNSLNESSNLMTKRREMIRWIIENLSRSENSLMPTEAQFVVLNHLREMMEWTEFSNSEWLDLMGDGSILFDQLNAATSIMQDQMDRADAVIDQMMHDNVRNLRTMDGHGRFLYCFLKRLQQRNQNIDEWTIDLVDIDNAVNGWHSWFMPEGVLVDDGNILDLTDIDLSATLIYFNFCGLQGQEDEVHEAIENIIEEGHHVFLSWSHRGGTISHTSPVYSFAEWTKKMRNKRKSTYIANRGKFFTYKFHPQQQKE
jgi:hypothetical protein